MTSARKIRTPSLRESMAVIAAQTMREVELLADLRALMTQGGARILEDLDPKQAERRRKNRDKVARHRAKKRALEAATTERLPRNQATASVSRISRGGTASAGAGYTTGYSNQFLPRAPSEKPKTKSKRPSAAKSALPALGRVWREECKNAGVESVIEDWNELQKLLFVQCAGDQERAAEAARAYIRACSLSKRTPSTRDLLTFTRRPQMNRNGHEASRTYLEQQARHEAEVREQRKKRPVHEIVAELARKNGAFGA